MKKSDAEGKLVGGAAFSDAFSPEELRYATLARRIVSPSKVDECIRELAGQPGASLKSLLIQKSYLDPAQAEELDLLASQEPPPDASGRLPRVLERSVEQMVGEIIGGVRLLKVLGRGGAASVYVGKNDRGEHVAVKILDPSVALHRDSLRRFSHEANAMAQLHHPNIVRVLCVGVDRGLHYMIQEYVVGTPLSEIMREGGALSLVSALKILHEVALALGAAHDSGIVHRDIKPENILILPSKRLKITDFGLAQLAEGSDQYRSGIILGTCYYMSPEQCRGELVDGRADVYALGVLLFYLLTGRWPFEGKDKTAVLDKHMHQPPPSPRRYRPNLPRAVEKVIRCCLEKDPAARYSGVRSLASDLKKMLARPHLLKLGACEDEVGASELDFFSDSDEDARPRHSARVSQRNLLRWVARRRPDLFWIGLALGLLAVGLLALALR